MERKAINPEKIIIREFRLIKGQIDSPFEFRISSIGSFNYKASFEPGINLEENLIKADFTVTVSTISKENTVEATGFYHFVFMYQVENLNEHVVLNDGDYDWNPYLANAIASITYSTSRGILLSRFQGTVLEDFILPVIDPNSLFKLNNDQKVPAKV